MIKNNIVSPIIERQEYKKKFENVLLSTQKLSYKQFYPKVFKPSEFMISFESNPFYLKSKYSRYDSHGNPLCITSDDLTTITCGDIVINTRWRKSRMPLGSK